MKLPVKLLAGCVINVTSKVITNSTVPIAIIAAIKDKKIEIEKFMLAPAKKLFLNALARYTYICISN